MYEPIFPTSELAVEERGKNNPKRKETHKKSPKQTNGQTKKPTPPQIPKHNSVILNAVSKTQLSDILGIIDEKQTRKEI